MDNEENTILERPYGTENDRLLDVPRNTVVNPTGRKLLLIRIILVVAILDSILGIVLTFFAGITNFQNPEYKFDTCIASLFGLAAFYIGIPSSSVYLIYQIIKNERNQTLNSTNTVERYNSPRIINHDTSTEASISRRYRIIQTIRKIWRDFACWQYFAAVIVVVFANLLDIGADFKETSDELKNLTNTTVWSQKALTISRIPSYILNCFLIICILWWVLHIYNKFAKENDKIRQLFTGNINDIEAGIDTIKLYSENVLTKKKNWKQQTLKNANLFASIYIFCCITWGVAYIYEAITVKQTITIGTILNSVAHFFSSGALVMIMWLTNKIIDKMKKTALQKMSFEYRNTTVDLMTFKTFIEHYDPYALFFTKKTHLPGIIATILSALGSLIMAYIKSRFPW